MTGAYDESTRFLRQPHKKSILGPVMSPRMLICADVPGRFRFAGLFPQGYSIVSRSSALSAMPSKSRRQPSKVKGISRPFCVYHQRAHEAREGADRRGGVLHRAGGRTGGLQRSELFQQELPKILRRFAREFHAANDRRGMPAAKSLRTRRPLCAPGHPRGRRRIIPPEEHPAAQRAGKKRNDGRETLPRRFLALSRGRGNYPQTIAW